MTGTGKSFNYPEDFYPSGYFYNSIGIIVDQAYPPEIIQLEVYGTKAKYFKALPLHYSQSIIEEGDGYTQFEYYMSPTYDLKQELLSHMDEIRVIAPEHLRNEIKEIAEKIHRNIYKSLYFGVLALYDCRVWKTLVLIILHYASKIICLWCIINIWYELSLIE